MSTQSLPRRMSLKIIQRPTLAPEHTRHHSQRSHEQFVQRRADQSKGSGYTFELAGCRTAIAPVTSDAVRFRDLEAPDRDTTDERNPAALPKDHPRYLAWAKRQRAGAAHRQAPPSRAESRCKAHAEAVRAIGGDVSVEQVMEYLGNGYSTTQRYLTGAVERGMLSRERVNREFVYRVSAVCPFLLKGEQ